MVATAGVAVAVVRPACPAAEEGLVAVEVVKVVVASTKYLARIAAATHVDITSLG